MAIAAIASHAISTSAATQPRGSHGGITKSVASSVAKASTQAASVAKAVAGAKPSGSHTVNILA